MNTTELSILFITGSLILVMFVLFLVLILMEYRKRQVRHITEKLRLSHQYESQVLKTKLEVQEQSFRHVSEEIHDNIAQTLSLVKLRLNKTHIKTVGTPFDKDIGTSISLLGDALNDLRNLSHVLNGGLVSRLTLEQGIEKELGYVREANEMQTSLTVEGPPYEPTSDKKLLIFRIVQEAVNNALKHGNATAIDVVLCRKQRVFSVQIRDNGQGFDVTKAERSGGLGLHNLFVRAQLLGTIDIRSEKEQGTTITLQMNTHES